MNVLQATPTFSNLTSPTITEGTASVTLAGNLSAGTIYPVGDTVSIVVNGTTLTTSVDANGNFAVSLPSSALPSGTYSITYTFAGDANFISASGTGMLTVNPIAAIAPDVTLNPITITYGTSLDNSQLSGIATVTANGQTVNVPGSFVFTTAAGAVLNAGSGQVEQVTFTPTDTVHYAAVSATAIVNVLQATPVFSNLSSPTITAGTATVNLSGNLNAGAIYPTGDTISISVNGATLTTSIDASGHFSISLPSTAISSGTYSISYAFAGDANFTSAIGTGTLTVNPGTSLSANGLDIKSVENQSFTGSVATFTNADPNGTTSTYTALIDWGDGTTSAGVINSGGAIMTVTGTHTYREDGKMTVHVTITDALGLMPSATTTSAATIADSTGIARADHDSDGDGNDDGHSSPRPKAETHLSVRAK